MNNLEKIALIEDALNVDKGTLKENTILSDLEEFDSVAKMSLIILCQDEFGKKLSFETLKEFQTLKDILIFMDS